MNNVAIVTGPVKACGIHVYASCLYEILKQSKKYNFYLLEVSSGEELLQLTDKFEINSVFYNWHPLTLPWCIPKWIKRRPEFNQFMITGHEMYSQQESFENIKAFLTIDPTLSQKDNYYPAVRPIKNYTDIQYSKPSEILKIGTSGFGERKKGFKRIVDILNQQFKDDSIELNVHFSVGHFVDSSGEEARQALNAATQLNSNIKLNVTHDFFTDYELIKWLNSNDINIYCYDHYDGPGVSASIDKALAARKPFAVNTSNYFKHVRKDIIDIDKTPIKAIVQNGIEPLREFYECWSESSLISQYEFLLEKYTHETIIDAPR